MENDLAGMKELLIGNIIFLGEIPSQAGTWHSDEETACTDYSVRARFFAERLLELGVDECTTDASGNPLGIIKGGEQNRRPILVVAELDSLFQPAGDIHYSLRGDEISGPGLMDNALGAAAILSLPDVIRRSGLAFRSNVLVAGISNTKQRKGGVALYERFLEGLADKPLATFIVKAGELGRLNYFSDAVVRADIVCQRRESERGSADNMIEVANEIVSRLLTIRTPKKPQTTLNVGIINAGFQYGDPAPYANIGLEVHSTDNQMLADIIAQVREVLDLVRYEERADIEFRTVAELGAANLGWNHRLTTLAIDVMKELQIEPDIYPSVSELYYFLRHGIPAITIGMTRGRNYHKEDATASISSFYKGYAQLLGMMLLADGMEK